MRYSWIIPMLLGAFLVTLMILPANATDPDFRIAQQRTALEQATMLAHGRYLTTIGVCEACHTPPRVVAVDQRCNIDVKHAEAQLKADPNWFAYLDDSKKFAGGVPFILRFGPASSGFVATSNLTPDDETGLGLWSESQIVDALRLGRRPDASALFVFAPHTFFKNLADYDAFSIAAYLKSLPAVRNKIEPRQLPFAVTPGPSISPPKYAPTGVSLDRAEYLMEALVGCKECHSYTDAHGGFHAFVGGDPADPYNGVFRLGPDLPLRQDEKGLAGFPYPGYAVLYGGNLTKFGLNGPNAAVPIDGVAKAIRTGVSPATDADGRPNLLSHVMMWQFYRHLSDADTDALAEYVKSLRYEQHEVASHLTYFGTDARAAFKAAFGSDPSQNDALIFNLDGKANPCTSSGN